MQRYGGSKEIRYLEEHLEASATSAVLDPLNTSTIVLLMLSGGGALNMFGRFDRSWNQAYVRSEYRI